MVFSKFLDENVARKIKIKRSLLSNDEDQYTRTFQPKRKHILPILPHLKLKREREIFEDSETECSSEGNEDQNEYDIKRESDEKDTCEEEFSEGESLEKSESEDPSDDDHGQSDNEKEASDEESSEENLSEEECPKKNHSYENHDDGVIHFDKDQARVLKYVENLLKDSTFSQKNSKIILVEGPAGTGKTEVLKALSKFDCQVIYTASTGVTAQNYEGGRTAHAMFGFPFDIHSNKKYDINDYYGQVSNASIIVYDAVNMADMRLIEMLNASLKELMGNNKPFGGKIMVFVADFMELGPIVHGTLDSNSFSVKFSYLLDPCTIKNFVLENPYRTREDADHFEFLLKLGYDSLTSIKNFTNVVHSPIKFVPLAGVQYSTYFNDIIRFVYPTEVLNDSDLCAKRAILTPSLKKAKEINEVITEMVAKKTVTCKSKDMIQNYELFYDYLAQTEMLIEDQIFPDDDLVLWKGCLCMVTQNMYQPSTGYYKTLLNGAKVIVVDIQDDLIFVRRPGKIETIPIEKKTFTGTKNGMKFKRKQFPLMLCYATTIHRSQGQTLEKVGVDLTEHVFTHGQLYLALSRVRCSDDLKVCIKKEQVIHGIPYTRNIVDRRLVEPTYIF